MTKYFVVVEIRGWINNSGWSYNQVFDTYEENDIPQDMDWSFIELLESYEETDTLWSVKYYKSKEEWTEGYDPIRAFEIWESEIKRGI